MSSIRKVAVVTGSNKGIGFAIVKGLCEKYDGDVYLTARDVARGQAAVGALKKLGLNPLFHQLDITDQGSVDNFKDYLKTKHGGLDVLVNNAAIAFKHNATEPFALQAKETIRVNYFATLRICEALFPLIRQYGRVVNVSSSAGHLTQIPSADLRAKFKSKNLDVQALNQLMEAFVKSAEENKTKKDGWGTSAYAVSKVGVSALTFVQQRAFDAETPTRNIAVNAVHPEKSILDNKYIPRRSLFSWGHLWDVAGNSCVINCECPVTSLRDVSKTIWDVPSTYWAGYVDTDMSSHKGPLTIEEGARAPLFLALEADFKGKYVWEDSTVLDWEKPVA